MTMSGRIEPSILTRFHAWNLVRRGAMCEMSLIKGLPEARENIPSQRHYYSDPASSRLTRLTTEDHCSVRRATSPQSTNLIRNC